MKVSNYHYHVVMQIQANFTASAKSIFYDFYWLIFVPYFFSFAFVIMASTFFHDFF